MNGLPGARHVGRRLAEVLPGVNTEQMEAAMRRVLETGDPVVNFHRIAGTPAGPGRDRVWSCSYFRMEDRFGHPVGVSVSVIDVMGQMRTTVRALAHLDLPPAQLLVPARPGRAGTGQPSVDHLPLRRWSMPPRAPAGSPAPDTLRLRSSPPTTPLVAMPVRTSESMSAARSTVSKPLPVNALTRFFVTIRSCGPGATSGCTSAPGSPSVNPPAVPRALFASCAKVLLRGLISGWPGRKPMTT